MKNMIGKKAPEWTARTYISGESKDVTSEDMKGKWYLMYWYPFDFTFICPTEIVGFEQLKDDFADDDITVIGCSTDSWHSHNAWFKDETIFPGGVNHHVIADCTQKITKDFGMRNDALGCSFRGTVLVNGNNSAIPVELAAVGRKLRRSRMAMLKSTAPEANKT